MPRIRIGLTMGDPAGVGPEVLIKALEELKGSADFFVIGDAGVLARYAQKKLPANLIDLHNVKSASFRPGVITPANGAASIAYLEEAVSLLRHRAIDALVTTPISKQAVSLAGFRFAGQTEFFAERFRAKHTLMLLLNRYLRFGLITTHLPIRSVPMVLSRQKIISAGKTLFEEMRRKFGLRNPRIACLALNPHASDNGILGDEENAIIKPALKSLAKKGICIAGPLSSDIAVRLGLEKKFDALLAVYHDQALIPLKVTGDESGVNMTLGLPFVRTSPLHGTAFDIAGKGRACAKSMIAAIRCAIASAKYARN